MRKRINSEEKFEYAGLPTLTIDIRKQKCPQSQSLREYCPPPRPKPQSLEKSKHSSLFGKELPAPRVRQFPNPLMKELRRLILNQIDSGDRIYHYLTSSTHHNILSLYRDDRKTLIQYLNTLIIRQTRLDSIRIDLDKKRLSNKEPQYPIIDNTLDSVEKTVDRKETQRRRSLSENQNNKEMDQVKRRLIKLEKGTNRCPYHHKQSNKPHIPKPKHSKNKESQKTDQILLNIKYSLQKAVIENQCKENFLLIEKEQIKKIIQNLSDSISEYNSKMEKLNKIVDKQRKSKEKLTSKLQKLQENPEMLYQSSKRLRSSRVQENSDNQYCQLKTKVNRLYDELAELVTEVESKDQVIQYLKIQNQNLRNNIVELEDLNRTGKAQQRTWADYVQQIEEKNRYLQDQIASKETEIIQMRADNQMKEKDIMNLTIESQKTLAKVQDKTCQKLQELTSKLSKLQNEKTLIKVEKEILQNACSQKDHLIKKLKQQISELQTAIETVKHEQSMLKINHDNLKSYFQSVKEENCRLLQTIHMQEKMMSHIELGQESNSQHQRNFSNEVNQSNSRKKDIFEQNQQVDNVIKHEAKTFSETGEQIIIDFKLKKQFSEMERSKKVKRPKQTLEDIYNEYGSDKDVRVSNMNQSSDKIVEKSDVLQEEIHVKVIKEIRSEEDKESKESNSGSLGRVSNKNRFQNYENQFTRMLQVEENTEKQTLNRSKSKDLPHVVLSDTIDKAAQQKGQIQVKGSEQNKFNSADTVHLGPHNYSSNGSSNRINRNIFIKWGSKEPMTPTPRSERTQSLNTLK